MAAGSSKNVPERTRAGSATAGGCGVCIVDGSATADGCGVSMVNGQMNGYEESGLTRKWPTISFLAHRTQTLFVVTVTSNFKIMLKLNYVCLQQDSKNYRKIYSGSYCYRHNLAGPERWAAKQDGLKR
jgi:hypothetical protein